MSNKIIYISPSRVETDWKCRRARYWGHEFDGVGLEPVTGANELIFGGLIHEGLAEIAFRTLNGRGDAIEDLTQDIASKVRNELGAIAGEMRSRELAALAEGLLLAFHHHIWPRLMGGYEIVEIEREFFLPLDETDAYTLTFRCRPDLILRHRVTGKLWYFEYKTTSNDSPKWINSWLRAVQLHVGCTAASDELGEPVEGCVVIGLYKGYDKYGRLNSPFTYGFKKAGVPAITADQFRYEYTPKWERIFIPDHMTMAEWVGGMPQEMALAQFPETPPMFVREDLIERFLEQQKYRERDVIEAMSGDLMDDVMDRVFPQTFSQCTPAWGRECQFHPACWMSHVGRDPVGSGYYVRREPR